MIGAGKSLLSIKKNHGKVMISNDFFYFFLDQEPEKEAISSNVLTIMNVSMVITIVLTQKREEFVSILMVVSSVHVKLDTLVMETIIKNGRN